MTAPHRRLRHRFVPLFAIALLLLPAAAPGEARIHVFGVFCDAYEGPDGGINRGVTADMLTVNRIFEDYFSEHSWGVTLRRRMINGSAATAAAFGQAMPDFLEKVGPNDTVYVHFCGHGAIPDPGKNEQFLATVDHKLVSRQVIAAYLEKLPCRLKILITDCCSTYMEDAEVAEGDEEVLPWKNLYSLFMLHEGFVDITAASPGEAAYGTDVGGYLTINLESDMQRFPTWQEVFAEASARVFAETTDLVRTLGGPGDLPQRPFAYSLGRLTGEQTPAEVAYVIPDSHRRLLEDGELRHMGLQQLYLARNEIFARHGYDFSTPFLREYFGSQPWYRRNPGLKSPPISPLERANSERILAVEKAKGGPFINAAQSTPAVDPSQGQYDAAPPDLFPYSSQTPLSRSVVQHLSPAQLSIARNEIFARHGFPFRSAVLQEFFSRKPYYRADPRATDPVFNPVENHNIWLIRKIERLKGGAYQW